MREKFKVLDAVDMHRPRKKPPLFSGGPSNLA
jgi:hypothetical protein